MSNKLKFIDLFAGLGGFHLALHKLGHECVFASEIDEDLQYLYGVNFPDTPVEGDINEVNIETIPSHNILCAGFPCQPFSKAGSQQGFNDEDRGNFFYKIMDILEAHKPEFILLENVANLKTHDSGNTWKVIKTRLETLYHVDDIILSPHHFGIPQHRNRIYIVGRLKTKGTLDYFTFPQTERIESNIKDIIEENDPDYMTIKEDSYNHMTVWQEFLDLLIENGGELPGFPIWAMEFGATYKYEGRAPFYQTKKELEGKRGKFGLLIQGNSKDDYLQCLPTYSQISCKKKEKRQFPDWKKYYIRQNREFYLQNQTWLDEWLPKIHNFENSHQKFEWNCGPEDKPDLYTKIIQFRPSGIRVKKPTYSPALVLTTTQIPIFPWVETPGGQKGRYMTRREAAKLQCMEDLTEYPDTVSKAFKAFGNAVNVEVVKKIAEKLLSYGNN
ncbi:MAG: DNA (cytosine-5-)-methyltransferase [Rikenellaceae bacterium]|nr:DNA (cytosine-5-)-methyltransferase [Rikenellaceae bacterium]